MTLIAASNYASSLRGLQRFEEAKSLLRRTLPVARRFLGESHGLTLKLRWNYAKTLSEDSAATLDDLREAVATLEDVILISRRVCGANHPTFSKAPTALESAREALARARGAAWFLIAREQHHREPGDSV